MNIRLLLIFFLCLFGFPAYGQRSLSQFDELAEAPNGADWTYLWDVSAGKSVKISTTNFFKAMPAPTVSTLGGVKRNVGGANKFVTGIDTDGSLLYGTPTGSGSGEVELPARRVAYGSAGGLLSSENGFEYYEDFGILVVPSQLALGISGSYHTLTAGIDGSLQFFNDNTDEDLKLNIAVGGANTAFWTSSTGVSLFDFGVIDIKVPSESYGAGWDEDYTVPTKRDVRNMALGLFNAPSFTGVSTVGGTWKDTPAPMAALAVDVTKALNTKTDNASRSITFTGSASVGQMWGLLWSNTGASAATITLPANVVDAQTGSTVSSFSVAANTGKRHVVFGYDGTNYLIYQGGGSSGGGGGSSAWGDITGKPTTLSGYGITDAQPLDTELTQLAALGDPNADKILGWDDSAGAYVQFTAGSGITISGTTISATGSATNTWTNLGAGTSLTLNTNYYVSLNANRTLTFSGGGTEGDRIRLRAVVSSGPITLTIPTSYRIGNSGSFTSLPLVDGDHMLIWEYVNSLWVLSDSSTDYEDAYTVYGNFSGGSAAPSFSNSGVLDFGPWTSLELPNNAAPTVDVVGEIAADNNLWATGRGALLHFDGTSTTALLGVLTSDTPGTGEVPTFNSNGTITWETLPDSLLSTEVDSSAEIFALVGDGAGSGSLLFNNNPLLKGTISWEGTTVDGFTIDITGEPTADHAWGVIDSDGYIALFDGGPLASTRIPFGHATNGTMATDSVFTFNSGTDTLAVPNLTLSTGGALGASTATTPSAGDNDTSLATTAFVQTEVDATKSNSFASPYTTASALSPTWSGPLHAVYMGVAQTVNLPAAASYTGRGIMVYNTGAFTITIDPSGSEVVVRDGTAQSAGVNFTLSSGAGNFVSLISDGTSWITLGYKGTLTVGS